MDSKHLSTLEIPRADTSNAAAVRHDAAMEVRTNAALAQSRLPINPQRPNGDETALANFIGCYSKGLPHSTLGEVNPAAYQALLAALASGKVADFEQLPRGLGEKLCNPLAANTYTLQGRDSHSFSLQPAPTFSGAGMAADMVELYWQAQLRDVNFSDYTSSALVQRAAADLNRLSGDAASHYIYSHATPANIFRGFGPRDLAGPAISQFLLKPYPLNSGTQDQTVRVGMPGVDYVRSYDEWSQFQAGLTPVQTEVFDAKQRYIRNGRDLAQWVHYDYPQLAFQNAAFIVFDSRPETILNKNVYQLNVSNPYKASLNQTGFVTFGMVHLLSLISFASTEALHAAWCQKWMVHRRLRPEAMGGRVHNRSTGAAQYPIHAQLLDSDAARYTFQQQGNYLLSQAYVEGSPLVPSYPSGHAAVAAAGATLMKAFFDENALVPNAVAPSADGLSVAPYNDLALTIGDESDKLAYNIAMGRNWAGVNYRSDAAAGLLLGEEVAIGILCDAADALTETFPGFQFTRFNGTPVTIKQSGRS